MGFVQVDEVSHDAGNPADVYAESYDGSGSRATGSASSTLAAWS